MKSKIILSMGITPSAYFLRKVAFTFGMTSTPSGSTEASKNLMRIFFVEQVHLHVGCMICQAAMLYAKVVA